MRSIKCVIIGDGAVGKTSLLISYTTNSFPEDYIPTVFDNYSTTIAIPDPQSSTGEQQLFKLNLWDTAGQEEYDRLRPLSYPQTDIFLICFSINEPVSFRNVIDKWFPEIKHNTNYQNMELYLECGKYPILLVGTKADLRDDDHEEDRLREMNIDFVSHAEIERVVNECGLMGYVECSAATQEGVREVFERAVDCVVHEPDRLLNKTKNMSVMINSTNLPLDNSGFGSHHSMIHDSSLLSDNNKQKSGALLDNGMGNGHGGALTQSMLSDRQVGTVSGIDGNGTNGKVSNGDNASDTKAKRKKRRKKSRCTIL